MAEMKRRWIIRCFFIGLLVLCAGGWGWSYRYAWGIGYSGHSYWAVECARGEIYLVWVRDSVTRGFPTGWAIIAAPATIAFDVRLAGEYGDYYYLRFHFDKKVDEWVCTIPFYCLTVLSTVFLWFAWRKTRPAAKGRAFPVEVPVKEKQP
jgi:hypothetical protein